MTVELCSWSYNGTLLTSLDKYRVFFHTSNCKSLVLSTDYIVDKKEGANPSTAYALESNIDL